MTEQLNIYDSLNKLFLCFSTPESLDETIDKISNRYSILYNKIFILESPGSSEFIITYNIDTGNISTGLLPNTILVHRKKESNTLYTINALNLLIKKLNSGVLDTSYKITWPDYKNSVLLTQGENLRQLETKIHKIVTVKAN